MLTIRTRRQSAIEEMEIYRKKATLAEVINAAALCTEDGKVGGKRHGHQCRIPGPSLKAAGRRLAEVRIWEFKTFDNLHSFIDQTIRPIHRIGSLVIYDISQRIGAYLKLAPQRVYLHAGTKVGARHLGLTGHAIEKKELPLAFCRLSAAEIEDCLCAYKDDIGRIMRRVKATSKFTGKKCLAA